MDKKLMVRALTKLLKRSLGREPIYVERVADRVYLSLNGVNLIAAAESVMWPLLRLLPCPLPPGPGFFVLTRHGLLQQSNTSIAAITYDRVLPGLIAPVADTCLTFIGAELHKARYNVRVLAGPHGYLFVDQRHADFFAGEAQPLCNPVIAQSPLLIAHEHYTTILSSLIIAPPKHLAAHAG